MKKTNEGAVQYEHALDHAVEFFSKAGSLFEKKGSYYGQEDSALSLFQKTWIVDPVVSFKLLLWLRDCRGGAGNRSGFRACLKWLAEEEPKWIAANIGWIPLLGRWDDLRVLFGTPNQTEAVALWINALKDGDILAAKWADRSDKPLRKELKFIKAIGIDTISITAFQRKEEGRSAHKILLKKSNSGRPMLIIEDLNLSMEYANFSRIFAIPIFIKGIDSAPCTVIGVC